MLFASYTLTVDNFFRKILDNSTSMKTQKFQLIHSMSVSRLVDV